MFKVLFLTVSVAAVAFGRPQTQAASSAAAGSPSPASPPSANVTYVKDERQPLDDKGTYKYDIELSDGTKFSQEGNTEAPGAGENETSIVIKGSYSYLNPEGQVVSINYIADKGGFQPVGDSIPKNPSSPSVPAGNSPAVKDASAAASSQQAQATAPQPQAPSAAPTTQANPTPAAGTASLTS